MRSSMFGVRPADCEEKRHRVCGGIRQFCFLVSLGQGGARGLRCAFADAGSSMAAAWAQRVNVDLMHCWIPKLAYLAN